MKRLLLLPALLLVLSPAVSASDRGEDALRRDIEFARRKVYPALVNISVVVSQYAGGRVRKGAGAGSGVIVSPAGHVITNYHVAGDTLRIQCTLPSRETIDAEVVAHDPLTDLSVLRLKMETRDDPNVPLPFASLGKSSALRVGDYILAMGNPMSLSSSMTLGIVSNPRRVFTSFTGSNIDEMELTEGQRTGLFTRWIQHDALILPGNSGGPLVNLQGEVVGINELGGNGVGFAIPSDLVSHVLNQALTYGEVRRGWLGLTFYPVDKIGRETGVLISSVVPQSPASEAGLEAGDVLLAIGKDAVAARFFEEIPPLYKRVADLPPGRSVTLVLERDGKTLQVSAGVARMEKYLGKQREFRSLGLTLRDITRFMALAHRYPDEQGVLVTGIRAGYAADDAKPRLRRGDVIRALAGKPVKDLDAFIGILEACSEAGEEKALFQLLRDDEEILTVVDLEKKEPSPQGGELPKAWIGIQVQVLVPAVAKALDLKGKKGFRVTQVFPETEAAKAGLRAGDIVYALNGSFLRAYRLQDSEMLRRRVEDLTIGTNATLSVYRDGKRFDVEVKLEETPTTAIEATTAKCESLEFAVRDITFMDRIRNKWPADQRGVVVTNVVPGGWASLGGLRGRDLILGIDDEAVADAEAFEKAVETIEETKPSRVKVFVKRGHRTAFVFIEPDWKE